MSALIVVCALVLAVDLYGCAALVRGFEQGWASEDHDRRGAR